jgi:hypothetical protein
MMRFGTMMLTAADGAFRDCTDRQKCCVKTERPRVKGPSAAGSVDKKKTGQSDR